jgi:hypothetical protein
MGRDRATHHNIFYHSFPLMENPTRDVGFPQDSLMNCSDQIITYTSYDDYGRNGPHDKYWHCFASYAPGKETLGTCRLFPLKLLLV